MKLLLDTHAWVWASQAPGELGKRTKGAMLAAGSSLFVSAVSHLEVARLASLGLLQLTVPVREWCRQALVELDAAVLAVDDAVALEGSALPRRFHADPAERTGTTPRWPSRVSGGCSRSVGLDYFRVSTKSKVGGASNP